MCGIAGYFGNSDISKFKIKKTLEIMKNRGPDSQNYNEIISKKKKVIFLHSRLSIIDLKNRSNQPFYSEGFCIIFNGEIYNYIELRNALIKKNIKFKTNSDTEVLLNYYKYYGVECLKYFEGMWSFAIYDFKKKIIFLSRDRFGEKPLYYLVDDQNKFFFGSEIKFIRTLSTKNLNINYDKISKFLNFGYKSQKKDNEFFFKKIKEVKKGEYLIINNDSKIKLVKYWAPKIKINNKVSLNETILKTKQNLIQSLKIRTRADVPIAFTLSGGIDSASLVSVASKILNLKFKTYSIIDKDPRYNESKNIDIIVQDLKCKNKKITLNKEKDLNNLSNVITYNEKPLASIAQYNHSLLMKEIQKDGYKVCINGTMADELFAGYYDHHLMYFASISKDKNFQDEVKIWKKNVLPLIRNPFFRKHDLYIKNKNFREHVYDNHTELKTYLNIKKQYKFNEKLFNKNILKNRMLNEIFYENTPQILDDEDLNSMNYSIENRSPFLDRDIFNLMLSTAPKKYIKNGFKKYILRKSMEGIVNKKILWDINKKGFNANITSLFDLKNKKMREYILNKNSRIYHFVNYNKFEELINKNYFPNSLSKFVFNVLNCQIFLDKFDLN